MIVPLSLRPVDQKENTYLLSHWEAEQMQLLLSPFDERRPPLFPSSRLAETREVQAMIFWLFARPSLTTTGDDSRSIGRWREGGARISADRIASRHRVVSRLARRPSSTAPLFASGSKAKAEDALGAVCR